MIVIVVASSWLFYLAGDIIAFSTINQTPQSDVAIVLGAAVWKNSPSPVFEERIKHAIALYQQGVVTKILFTEDLETRNSMLSRRLPVTMHSSKGLILPIFL
ncbi:hypothetical protein [Candidatus Electrothrix sp.]|uniref:hypothetical protein n=1 Tax=Candidatus Electrothrix sp. TaxID=2170559 RepID=UPI00405657F3